MASQRGAYNKYVNQVRSPTQSKALRFSSLHHTKSPVSPSCGHGLSKSKSKHVSSRSTAITVNASMAENIIKADVAAASRSNRSRGKSSVSANALHNEKQLPPSLASAAVAASSSSQQRAGGRGRSRSDADSLPPTALMRSASVSTISSMTPTGKRNTRSMTNSLKRPKSMKRKPGAKDDDFRPPAAQSGKRSSIKPMKMKSVTLSESSLRKCEHDLTKSFKDDQKEILYTFKLLKQVLSEQESKLLKDLQSAYDGKKGYLKSKGFDLKSKQNGDSLRISFNPNIALILDKNDAVRQIKELGYIDFVDDEDLDLDGNLFKSRKQKKLLSKLQSDSMSKLNTIITMQEQLRKKQSEAIRLRAEVDADRQYIDKVMAEINVKVEAAKPEIERARAAVSSIEKKDLDEIKSLKSPPPIIELAMSAVAILLGNEIKTWRDVQKILSYRFVPEILKFDGRNVIRSLRERVETDYMNKDDFNYERVNEGSKVCGCMVLWVTSQVNYSRALDDVVVMQQTVDRLKRRIRDKLKTAEHYERIVKELQISIEKYEAECQQMIQNIIKDTHKELKEHEDTLNPLNSKFFNMLNIV